MGDESRDWLRHLWVWVLSSALGLLLYILYTEHLTRVITALGALVHHYTDDVKIYTTCYPSDALYCI